MRILSFYPLSKKGLPYGKAASRLTESYFVIEITDGLIRYAGDLAEKHLLRGFDSIHLASAVNLKNKTRSEIYFSSNDAKLNRAAEKEGLTVL